MQSAFFKIANYLAVLSVYHSSIKYPFFFQHPLADLVVPADDLAFVDRLWRDWSPGHDPGDDLDAVVAGLAADRRGVRADPVAPRGDAGAGRRGGVRRGRRPRRGPTSRSRPWASGGCVTSSSPP